MRRPEARPVSVRSEEAGDRDAVRRLLLAAFQTSAEARLVEAGLEQARADGCTGVAVPGDPAYYRRFSFRPEAVRGMASPCAGPAPMGLAFAEGGLGGPRIEHAPAFASV